MTDNALGFIIMKFGNLMMKSSLIYLLVLSVLSLLFLEVLISPVYASCMSWVVATDKDSLLESQALPRLF